MTSDIKSRILLFLIGLTLVSLAVPGVTAAGLQEVGVLANGPSFDLMESNGYLYAGQGSEVVTYDVSTSAKISALTWRSGLSRLLVGGPVRGICADAGYLYIAAENRFVIADISNPASPKLVSSLNSGGTDVLIKDTYAYLLSPGTGVRVIDVSNRTAPRIVKTVYLAGKNKPRRGTIDNNYLYVGMETDNRLDIIDISNPQNSNIVGSHKVNGTATISGVAVKGGYAYITEYHNGVRVIDVRNPAKTMEVTRLLGIDANDIKIQGNYAYVSVRYQGFSIITISDPRNIRIVGQSNAIQGYIEGIYVTPTNTFLSADTMGFGVFDTSNVTAPRLLSQVAVIGFPEGITVRNNFLYIGAHNDGVWIVDVSNPAIPKETAYVNSGGRNREVSLQGNNLYVAGEWQRLYVLNVSDPQKPKITLSHFGDNIGNVLADGNYVYTSLGIVDFSNPASPVYVAKSSYFGGKTAKYGNKYLLVAANGIRILDVSDKKNPVLVATYGNGTSFKDVDINGKVAVALTGNSIVAIDISNVAAPKKLSQLDYPGHWTGYALAMNGTVVYAAGSGSENIRAFDISNPSAIKLVGSLGLYGDFWSIAYDNGYIYAAEKMSLHILSTSLVPPKPVIPVKTVTPVIPEKTVTPVIPGTAIHDNIGEFSKGVWHLDSNDNNVYNPGIDMNPNFGILSGDISVVGDWNGDNKTEIGVFRGGHDWYLDYNGNGGWDGPATDRLFTLGQANDTPVTGDWNGDGITEVGVFRKGVWYVDWNNNGVWDSGDVSHNKTLGMQTGDIPVVGDWNGDGITEVGVFRKGVWYVDWNNNGVWDSGDAPHSKTLGILTGDIPVVGDWNGDRISEVGVFRKGVWYVDWNNNGVWDSNTERTFTFGTAGWTPVVGKWN